jgi:RNA polymerase sigma factor (sigma-70 family)
MKWELATNQQLKTIIDNDKDIPTPLLSGVVLEMIQRNMWEQIIFYSARKAYRNYSYVIENILRMDFEEFIQIAHIELLEVVKKFQPGMRTFKTYAIMCLIGKFTVLLQNATAKKRASNINTYNVDTIPSSVFQSTENVEKYVINKITIEEAWDVLRDIEKQAITLEYLGYTKQELAVMLGFKARSGKTILSRAYAKLRKAMVA